MLSYTFRFTVILSARSNINVEKLRSTLAKASGVYQLLSSVLYRCVENGSLLRLCKSSLLGGPFALMTRL